MLELLSSTQRRRLKILKILNFTHKRPISVDYLAKVTRASQRTVAQDLDKIQRLYPFITIVPYTSLKGEEFLRMSFGLGHSIKSVYQALIGDKLVFKALEILIHDESLGVDELAERLFTSHSTLYRAINDFNKVARKVHGVKIETSPCRLVGEEARVRSFFAQFLFESQPFTAWPFEEIDVQAVEALLDYALEQLQMGLPPDYARYHHTKLFVAVNLARYQRGYLVEAGPQQKEAASVLAQALFQEKSLEAKAFRRAFFSEALLSQSQLEGALFQLFFHFLQVDVALNWAEFEEILAGDGQKRRAVQFLQAQLEALAQKVGVPLPNGDQLAYILYNEAVLGKTGTMANFILFDEKAIFLECFERFVRGSFQEIPPMLEEFLGLLGRPADAILLRHLYFSLLTNWEGLVPVLKGRLARRRVLVLSSFGPAHGRMYTQRLRASLDQVADFYFYNEPKLDLARIQAGAYDVILTNVNLPYLPGTQVLYVEACPTEANQRAILEALIDI